MELINEENIKKYIEKLHNNVYARPDEIAFFDLIQFIIYAEDWPFWQANREYFKEYIGI